MSRGGAICPEAREGGGGFWGGGSDVGGNSDSRLEPTRAMRPYANVIPRRARPVIPRRARPGLVLA